MKENCIKTTLKIACAYLRKKRNFPREIRRAIQKAPRAACGPRLY